MDILEELRPLHFSMALVGLYHDPEGAEPSDAGTEPNKPKRRVGSAVYCAVVVCLLWFTFLRYMPSFWVGPDAELNLLADRVIYVFWFLQCASHATNFFLHCKRKNRLPALLKQCRKLLKKYGAILSEMDSLNIEADDSDKSTLATSLDPLRTCENTFASRMKNYFNRCCRPNRTTSENSDTSSAVSARQSTIWKIAFRNAALTWTVLLFTLISVYALIYSGFEQSTRQGIVICNPFPGILPVKIVFSVLQFLDACGWIFPMTFTCTLCSVLHLWFSRLTDAVRIYVGEENEENEKKDAKIPIPSTENEIQHNGSKLHRNFEHDFDHDVILPGNDDMPGEGSFIVNGDGRHHEGDVDLTLPLEKVPAKRKVSLHDYPVCFVKVNNKNDSSVHTDLKLLRRLHLELCACVSILDRTVCHLLMISYVTAIPLTCFVLYQIIQGKMAAFTIVIASTWIMGNMSQAFLTSLFCARVHEAAHSSLEYLYFADVSTATPEQRDQLKLFLSKLTGPPIGFTAFGIIIVTKEMMLTVVGILVTYFFLLLQFNIQ